MDNQCSDECSVICPYCGHKYYPQAEDYCDEETKETCDECRKTFLRWDETTVTHYTRKIEG